MARVIEITEKKINKLSSLVEDMLLAGGELMHCISKMEDEFYGERRSSGGGNYYGNRYGDMGSERHHDSDYDRDDWDESDEMRRMIGERRRRRGMR